MWPHLCHQSRCINNATFYAWVCTGQTGSTQGWLCVIKVRATEQIKKCSSPPLSPPSDELRWEVKVSVLMRKAAAPLIWWTELPNLITKKKKKKIISISFVLNFLMGGFRAALDCKLWFKGAIGAKCEEIPSFITNATANQCFTAHLWLS